MEVPRYAQIAFVIVLILTAILFGKNYTQDSMSDILENDASSDEIIKKSENTIVSNREIIIEDNVILPIKNIVSTEQVIHSIPIAEIRQGCSRQDCIPSVDTPVFISNGTAVQKIDPEQIGIALSYKGEERFYPFSMLVTKEIVNDVVAGDPLLVTYCPLCGTGIVFDRTVDGVVYEFGVSGMLWQSNLLMYNRAKNTTDRNIWSQVLGEAVVGDKTGTMLSVIMSDIMQFKTWAKQYPDGVVLDTGNQHDPYNGEYYAIAQRFAPDFDVSTSALAPDAYVYGIEVSGTFKAYPRDLLSDGEFHDMINGEDVTISNVDSRVTFKTSDNTIIVDIEGFWFSWVSAHPDTLLWSK